MEGIDFLYVILMAVNSILMWAVYNEKIPDLSSFTFSLLFVFNVTLFCIVIQ